MRINEAMVLAAATFALNLVWEIAQSPFYADHGSVLLSLALCVRASLGDIVIVAVIYTFFALIYRDLDWPKRLRATGLAALVVVGGFTGVAIEGWALATGRWQYAAMPILPVVEVGLLPVFQMMIIPPVILWAYARYAARA